MARVCLATIGALRFSAHSSAVRLFILPEDREMEKIGTAFFVGFPRILDDLKKPHLIEAEQRYEIVKTVTLGKMDYDNFCSDMVADRQYIEDNFDLCGTGSVWKCLFVHQRGHTDGILIVPTDGCYVKYAAYISSGE